MACFVSRGCVGLGESLRVADGSLGFLCLGLLGAGLEILARPRRPFGAGPAAQRRLVYLTARPPASPLPWSVRLSHRFGQAQTRPRSGAQGAWVGERFGTAAASASRHSFAPVPSPSFCGAFLLGGKKSPGYTATFPPTASSFTNCAAQINLSPPLGNQRRRPRRGGSDRSRRNSTGAAPRRWRGARARAAEGLAAAL